MLYGLLLLVTGFLLLIGVFAWQVQQQQGADWGHPGLNWLDGLNRIFCRKYHRFEHQPIALPDTGAALVIANHISGLDPMLMIAASPRPLHFMIAAEQFNRFGLRWFFRWIECIPVDRQRSTLGAFRSAKRALDQGKVIAMFPQGKIVTDVSKEKKIKPGVVRLAIQSNATIYPVRVSGINAAGHTVLAPLFRSHARLECSPPIRCGEFSESECLSKLSKILYAQT